MNKKHIWIGIVVLVCLCLFVSSASAAKTTLKEDYVDLAQSYYTDFEIPEYCQSPGGNKEMIRMMLDYEKKGNEYTKYIIYNASIDNVVAYSSIPDVVTQSITINAGGYDTPEWVGTGAIKIHKLAYNDSGYVHADMVVELDIDQTWQNGISGDRTLDFADGNKEYTFSNLASFYDAGEYRWGASRSLGIDIIWDTTGAAEPYEICNELGLTLFATNQLVNGDISSAEGLHTIGILSDFYNAYEIYVEETYEGEPIKYVDITRDCDECEQKNTRSKVVVLDEDGEVLLDSPFYQDTNISHPFGSVGINVFLGAANMSEGGTGTEYVFLYSDTEEEPPDICYVKGYTYNAETTAPLSDVSVTLNGHSDTSDGDGVYFVGPIFTGKNYTLTATKLGYHDVVYPLYLAYGQDYLIDLPLIPVHPTHTGHGILGTVTTLPYHGICENHTVNIENSTWSDTTTANSVGYYLFDNLEVDDYWINVTKDGYRDNNQSVTVSATGDEIVAIDNCDATTNWSSGNSLTLNTTDKQEGTGSLQSSGSNTLDFNKSAPTAIDASNVTKSNGYTTFWYKINDTTRITDYLVFTIGSNGDNTTDKISWSVHKANFVNDTWKEVWLKFSDGTENGTLNMSNIDWTEVKAAKSDTVVSKIDNIRFYDFSYEIHDVDLDPVLSLGVIAKTLNEDTIQTVTAILDGDSLNTTSGEELIFTDLSYGMHELTVTSEEYFPYQQSIYLDSNTNITAYMTTEAEGGVGVYYPPPHLVEFRVQNTWGKPFSDALVTVQGYSTTMGTWDWLYDIFGYSTETQIHNATMSDTTDSNGHLDFLMVETVKYQINVSDTETPARFGNKTFWVYPKDERYNLVVSGGITWQKAGTEEQKEMSINVTTNIINSTAAFLNASYNDPSNQTESLTIYVNHTINNNEEECLNSSNWVNTSVQEYSYIASPYKGRAYKIQVVTEHEEWGSRTWTYAKRFPGMLIDLNLPAVAYPMIAISVLILLGGVFGRSSATQGSAVICFFAWIFFAIGFFAIIDSVVFLSALSLASVVSIIAIMMEKSRKTGVQ